MAPNLIAFSTMGLAWLKCVNHVIGQGNQVKDGSVALKECISVVLQVQDPNIHDEVMAKIPYWGSAPYQGLDAPVGAGSVPLPFDYKSRLHGFPSEQGAVDQYGNIRRRLQAKPDAKSATAVFLKPGHDTAKVPCLVALDHKIREGRLLTQAFFRSQDVWNKQPRNLVFLRTTASALAEELGVALGPIILYVASAHIYEHDYPAAQECCLRLRDQIMRQEVGRQQ